MSIEKRKVMTVGELIAELMNHDESIPVVIDLMEGAHSLDPDGVCGGGLKGGRECVWLTPLDNISEH